MFCGPFDEEKQPHQQQKSQYFAKYGRINPYEHTTLYVVSAHMDFGIPFESPRDGYFLIARA
jgi:hypothetical protein